MAPAIVAVPAKGIERWLSQQLSAVLGAVSGDGVCANVLFPNPAALLDQCLADAHPDMAASVETWSPSAAVWPILETITSLPDDADYAALKAYVDKGRRYAAAAKVATLFATYAAERPEMFPDWAGVPDDLRWQARLWQQIRERIGLPCPAELHDEAVAALAQKPDLLSLPESISVFGLSRITRTWRDALAALARHRDVHVFVHHPGAALWNATAAAAADPDGVPLPGITNRLLVSLSRDICELQQRLSTPDLTTDVIDEPLREVTLLARLQRDLRSGQSGQLVAVAADDRSVQIHACHGAARQVEVLREAVLQILKDDPTLEPRDVLVMCPDVETYAPLLKAVFDTAGHPAGRLRLSVADRSPRQTNALLGLAARLLELAVARVTASEGLDFAGLPAVRQAFSFTDDDIEQLREWTVTGQIHWGLDRESRAPWRLRGVDAGTWEKGLDRLVASVALSADTVWADTAAVTRIESTNVTLVGRLAEMVDRLAAARRTLEGPQRLAQWLDNLEAAVFALGATRYDTEWQAVAYRNELAQLRAASEHVSATLTLSDFTVLLEGALAGRPTRSSFGTGGMTVCTLTPMRSVPHKVVCLLGLDDVAFPRHSIADGDDLLARDRRPGERDPRSEDRQLFLEAILAAESTLVITYTGADVRTGAPLPPAVPVGELLDALDLTGTTLDGRPVRGHVVVHHPLQPFDPRNFTSGTLLPDGPFSFDSADYGGACVVRAPARSAPPIVDAVLPDTEDRTVTVRQLKDFAEHPAKAFLRQRLNVMSGSRDDEPQDSICLQLDHLQTWSLGDRVVRGLLEGRHPSEVRDAEIPRGLLPPGSHGVALMRDVGNKAIQIVDKAKAFVHPGSTAFELDTEIAGCRLSGSIQGVTDHEIVTVTFSKVSPKQRLRAWIDLLCASVAHPAGWSVVLVGRSPVPRQDAAFARRYGPVTHEDAVRHLTTLLQLRSINLVSPLFCPVESGYAYATARENGDSHAKALNAAEKEWQSGYFDKEDRDADNALVWGDDFPFSAVPAWTSAVDLPRELHREACDFATLARAIWQPLRLAEGVA
jgi:exodeoxyribonuclease V gamma subunit